MKSIISILAVIAFAVVAFATPASNTVAVDAMANDKPSDIAVVQVGSGNGKATADSFPADIGIKRVGPVRLSVDKSRPSFKYVTIKCPAGVTTASTGNIQVAYQLLPTNSLADTTATWSVIDTIVPTGIKNAAVLDLSALPAQSIAFRFFNYGSSVTALLKKINIVFKESGTAQTIVNK
jgi:hypothetical protein